MTGRLKDLSFPFETNKAKINIYAWKGAMTYVAEYFWKRFV